MKWSVSFLVIATTIVKTDNDIFKHAGTSKSTDNKAIGLSNVPIRWINNKFDEYWKINLPVHLGPSSPFSNDLSFSEDRLSSSSDQHNHRSFSVATLDLQKFPLSASHRANSFPLLFLHSRAPLVLQSLPLGPNSHEQSKKRSISPSAVRWYLKIVS